MINMIRKIRKKILNHINLDSKIKSLERVVTYESDIQKMLLGKILIEKMLSKGVLDNIQESEFKVFSQWGDDGIIQYIINNIDIPNKTFVEFGVENYTEANTRFLLTNNNWSGLIIDSSKEAMEQVRDSGLYPRYDLTAIQAFVDTENINDLIATRFKGEIGLLHIDIDGNDYWIWKAITIISPIIVIMEYNSAFGINRPITVPYDKDFDRTKKHYSNIYYGSSLLSLCDLAEEKGYIFIGTNSCGGNSYFIRKDKIGNLKTLTPENGYVLTKTRECRDKNNNLTFISPQKAIKDLKDMSIFNTRENKIETL
jgi:hypothetical protein